MTSSGAHAFFYAMFGSIVAQAIVLLAVVLLIRQDIHDLDQSDQPVGGGAKARPRRKRHFGWSMHRFLSLVCCLCIATHADGSLLRLWPGQRLVVRSGGRLRLSHNVPAHFDDGESCEAPEFAIDDPNDTIVFLNNWYTPQSATTLPWEIVRIDRAKSKTNCLNRDALLWSLKRFERLFVKPPVPDERGCTCRCESCTACISTTHDCSYFRMKGCYPHCHYIQKCMANASPPEQFEFPEESTRFGSAWNVNIQGIPYDV